MEQGSRSRPSQLSLRCTHTSWVHSHLLGTLTPPRHSHIPRAHSHLPGTLTPPRRSHIPWAHSYLLGAVTSPGPTHTSQVHSHLPGALTPPGHTHIARAHLHPSGALTPTATATVIETWGSMVLGHEGMPGFTRISEGFPLSSEPLPEPHPGPHTTCGLLSLPWAVTASQTSLSLRGLDIFKDWLGIL